MDTTTRQINELAQTTTRVKCGNGHWVAARTVLATDLRTRRIAQGQQCPTCKSAI
jgi:hypothetical protein